MTLRVIRRIVLAGLVSLGFTPSIQAQDFPARPITIIVPFAAGGPSDLIARLLGEHMTHTLGQPVVVENVGGAGGTMGARRLVSSQPDGYTLLIHHLALAAAPSLYSGLSYETKTAFDAVGLINTGPMVVVGRRDLPPKDGKAFFDFAKANASKLTIAQAGIGSNAHLCAVLMSQALGANFTQVAYRGTGPAMNDLVAGQVDILCDQSTTAVPQIEGKTVSAFAVTSPKRIDVLKDVPTTSELGIQLNITIWHGLYAPKGTPTSILDRLNAALRAALKDMTIQDRFKSAGTELFPEAEWTRQAHARRFKAEVDRWASVLKAAGSSAGASGK